MTGMGAFASGQSREAMSSVLDWMVKKESSSTTGIGSNLSNSEENRRSNASTNNIVNALNTGAFNSSNVHDARRESVAEYMARVTGSSSSSSGSSQNSVNELNRVAQQLNGSSSSSDNERSIETSLARTMDWLESAGDTGIASSSNMDYSEQTRGMVNTLLTNRAQLESDIERRRIGGSSGSSLIPGMDEVAAYLLGEQSEKMAQMVALLASIDAKIGPGGSGGPAVIGPNRKQQRHIQHGGVDMNAMSQVNSRWGITFNDAQPGDVTTDGSGPYG